MFFTKKKVISALVLGGAGATAAVVYALKGGVSEEVVFVKRSDKEISDAADKYVKDFGEVDGGEVF